MEKRNSENWEGLAILREGRPPSGNHMKLYLSKLERFRKCQHLFLKKGFTYPIAKKLISLAQLNDWELYHLFRYAKRIPDGGIYLEIGSWVGGSLMCVHEAAKVSGARINLIAIECSLRKQLLNNTKSIPQLQFIGCASSLAKDKIKDNSVDLLFLDASHEYDQTKKELEDYWPKIKPGGLLLGHDYRTKSPGVIQAVNERFISREGFAVLPNSNIFMVKKTK